MTTTKGSSTVFYLEDYRFGAMLAEQGIGLWELSRNWRNAFKNEHVMRGYRETWKRWGYAAPPGEIWAPGAEGGERLQ
jgi:hypothetical protein